MSQTGCLGKGGGWWLKTLPQSRNPLPCRSRRQTEKCRPPPAGGRRAGVVQAWRCNPLHHLQTPCISTPFVKCDKQCDLSTPNGAFAWRVLQLYLGGTLSASKSQGFFSTPSPSVSMRWKKRHWMCPKSNLSIQSVVFFR